MTARPTGPDEGGPRPRAQDPDGEFTELLAACSDGDAEAFDRLIPLVYGDLKAIAHRRLRTERAGHTLDTTAVVHEAYLKLVEGDTATWQDRAHFFAVASRVIRHVLIDYARRRAALKRGGDRLLVPLRENLAGQQPRTVDLLAMDEALTELARQDPRMERLVECRFYGGMTMAETAKALGVSRRTAERVWTRAKAHLFRSLSGSSEARAPNSAAN